MVSLMIGTFGASAMSGHQIAINIASVTFMVPLGLSIAISIRVGRAKGSGNSTDARYIGFAGIFLCIIVMTVTASIFILVPEIILWDFTLLRKMSRHWQSSYYIWLQYFSYLTVCRSGH